MIKRTSILTGALMVATFSIATAQDQGEKSKRGQAAPPHVQAKPKPIRSVPTDTYAALSVNWRAVLEKVDFEEPLMAKLRQLDHLDQSYLEDPKPERIVMMFPSQVNEKTRFASPPGRLTQFAEAVEPEAFFDRKHDSRLFETGQEDYKGQQIHSQRWAGGIYKGTELRSVWYFPEKNVVGSGSRQMVRQMIDGESSKSGARELVNKLDPKPELHFIVEVNDKVSAHMLDGLVGHLTGMHGMKELAEAMRHARRMELRGHYAEDAPLQVMIEMKDDEAMDRLMALIKDGLALAPAAFDSIEEHEIPEEAELQPPYRDLLALARTALEEMKIERDGATLRMTLGHVDGLEKLPHLWNTCMMIRVAMSGP